MNADERTLPLPLSCSLARYIDGVRELAQWRAESDTYWARWDTVLTDGRRVHTMDVIVPVHMPSAAGQGIAEQRAWLVAALDRRRPAQVKAFAAMEQPQER